VHDPRRRAPRGRGDHRRDRRRHDRLPDRQTPGLMGRHVSRQRRVRRQATNGQDAQQLQMVQPDARGVRQEREPQQEHLRVRGGGLGEREGSVDLDAQAAVRDPPEQDRDHRVDARVFGQQRPAEEDAAQRIVLTPIPAATIRPPRPLPHPQRRCEARPESGTVYGVITTRPKAWRLSITWPRNTPGCARVGAPTRRR
jgi:hypothetical protein